MTAVDQARLPAELASGQHFLSRRGWLYSFAIKQSAVLVERNQELAKRSCDRTIVTQRGEVAIAGTSVA